MDPASQQVRRLKSLESVWRHVRQSASRSKSKDIRAAANDYYLAGSTPLKSIQTRLAKGTFRFPQQRGIPRERAGKKPRPLVVAPLDHRIVSRALLEVGMGFSGIAKTKSVHTSYGGIRSVSGAIGHVIREIKAGKTHYMKSDIPDFFTNIPRIKIADEFTKATGDSEYGQLVAEAMATDLENEDDLGSDREVFPDGVIGVPQGSALSTLAGNLLLFDFDQQMNGREVVCIRYVDDFIILGSSQKSVKAAFSSANEMLSKLHLKAYAPDENPEKASTGKVTSGFDFLGCKLTPGLVQPTRENRTKVVSEVRKKLADGKLQLSMVSNEPVMLGDRYAQIIDKTDHYLEGWANHFSFCNGDQCFISIDGKIDELYRDFNTYFDHRSSNHIPTIKRHLSGLRSVRLTVINRRMKTEKLTSDSPT